MKKIIPLVLVTLLMLVSLQSTSANTVQQNVKNNAAWLDFYKHVFFNAAYTEKAKEANLQGNSLVLFTIAAGGQLKNLKVEAELGLGLDLSIVNGILSYANFKKLKVGKYALTTLFLIDESKAEIRNKDIKIPQGYTALEKIVVAAFALIGCGPGPSTSRIVSTPKLYTFSSDIMVALEGKVLNSFKNNTKDIQNIKGLRILKRPPPITDYDNIGKNSIIVSPIKQKENADTTQKKNTSIQLRGTSSQINSPLYIVDDELVDSINAIDPNKIQNITILRNASAFALYGDSAKNGVIIITTKKETKQISKP
ncbi:TonB-dependent receptor plug domain-containing protein [Pedobacter sp. Hv1]|uniref:TonB-dependent receptor plug domain-containing protein n=1 Tax=Pedobacter sp. Hv1 TaxID=1740090 RepID=UPI0006D8CB2B|nr:TonB-dependent receptor plug domain-containing protein [Pedobacter sp. Hv1]KQB99437.1 hypothetical protein AQF98_17870 [Pedobacter sp. Hv1]